MKGIACEGRAADNGTLASQGLRLAYFALLAAVAFGLYWLSSAVLQARSATLHFGADAHLYSLLAQGNVIDRVGRFHPLTIALAMAWMKMFSPLIPWLAPAHVLKAMFAAVGAVGVCAATSAFAAVIPRRYAMLLGAIYAVSFGVWYFSSIEESKIVTASLSALYIAIYLQLRERWTRRGALLLTAILLLACLNEIVSGFLIVIPIVDTLVRRGWDWRSGRWIAAHALAGPIALVILEGVVNGRLVAAGRDAEGASHLAMLLFYVSRNDFSAMSLYAFLANWLFFNIAAPTPFADYAVPAGTAFKGYFEPALANYFSGLLPAGLVALFGVMVVASVVPRHRAASPGALAGILPALMAYTLLRAAFFFIFNPREALLFTPAVTLAHLLIIAVPFTASSFPAKRLLLAALAVLLFLTNGAFIIGR